MKKHIYLTGFMGAGKSKIGPLLAKELKMDFFDTDKLIENEEKKTVQQIFEDTGETHFRNLETKMINRLATKAEPVVIALGGGALNRKDNYRQVNNTGHTVYIKSSPEAIFDRVQHSTKRPLLKVKTGPGKENRLLNRIKDLLEKRRDIYEAADIIVDRDNLEIEEIIKHIKKQLRGFGYLDNVSN